ncbi:calcium/calmodulin-dependent protein kinase, putative [Plasmodium vivax]|nr:calcium/calmodulin-dependent protein kinase, putative [Plasmodium vivax]
MESNGAVQEIPEKRKKRKIADLEAPFLGSANVATISSAISNARVCPNPSRGAADQHKNKKKIIKLKNRKIEDLFVIRNFLPICEEFLVKHHEGIFSNFLQKQDGERKKAKGKAKSSKGKALPAKSLPAKPLLAIAEEPRQDEPDVDRRAVKLEQSGDRTGGRIKEEEPVGIKVKREKSESVECLGEGSESVECLGERSEEGESADDLGEGPTVDSEKGSPTNGAGTNRGAAHPSPPNQHRSHPCKSNHHRNGPGKGNLYRSYVRRTKQSLREMNLPFDRAVLLNVVDKKDSTSKIMKIVNKKKVISAFGDTWENMIEHILSMKQHKNLMKIYDIYDDDKNFYMIMEKLHGKELFSFLVYKKQVKESVCKYILSQIFQAVNYLHHHNIIHRDIKPENLMFRNKKRKDKPYEYNYELVLIDFDTCQFVCPPSGGRLPGVYYPPGAANLRRSLSPSSSTNGTVSDCAKLCRHGEVRKMEQKKGSFFPGQIHKGCSKTFSERSTKQRSGTSNVCNHSGRKQQPRTKSSSGKKHMKLVGTYGYIAPEIIKGYNYSILSDMWSIGIIFYILMTGITPLPMCLMVNYKNTKDIILKKEKKGINFGLLSFNNYPLARDLCEKLLQFDPSKRIPNSVIASNHPWLRYFNMLRRNVSLCTAEREYLAPPPLSQNPLSDAPYVKNKRPRYEDRNNCHVVFPYRMHEQVYQQEHLHPFMPLSNEQRFYYLINQGMRNCYAVGNGVLPHPGLSAPLEGFPYLLRGGNPSGETLPVCGGTLPLCGGTLPLCGDALPLCGDALPLCGDALPLCGDTLPICAEKVFPTARSAENDFEGKTHPVSYHQDRDGGHPPRISHQFGGRHSGGDGEGVAPARHVQKGRRGEEEEEDANDAGDSNDADASNDADEDEIAANAQRRRPFRKKTGNISPKGKERITGAALHESENGNHGSAHRCTLTQQDLHSRDDDYPPNGSYGPTSVHPEDDPPPDCNNFVDLFEHLIENKKRKFTLRGKPFDQLPPLQNPFPMYLVPSDEHLDGADNEIGKLSKRKGHLTTKEKNEEHTRAKNPSEVFSSPSSHSIRVTPQNDPAKTIQIDKEHKRAYDFAPPRHVHLPSGHLSLPHRGGRPNVILLPQPLPPSLLPLVYHHSSELRNNIVLNDKGHLTNSSDDIDGVASNNRHPNMCYANVPASAYDPCQVTNLYETSTSLTDSHEQQLTLQEAHQNGLHSHHHGFNANLARAATATKFPQNVIRSKIPHSAASSMFPQNRDIPPLYLNYRRAYKNSVEMVPTMFRED